MLICIGIPVYDRKPYCALVDSLLAEQLRAVEMGVHLLPIWVQGVALIGHARNQIAADFLGIPEASCLVSVDSDISWKTGDLLKIALSEHDVIGATYRTKREDEQYHIHGFCEEAGDLYKVGGLPGGFVKTSRWAFERLSDTTCQYKTAGGRVLRDFYPTGLHDEVLYGEDYGFCQLWREAGGDVFLDASIQLRHHDGGTVYTGDPEFWIGLRSIT